MNRILWSTGLLALLLPATTLAQIEKSWNKPVEPHHVVANIYYVGTNFLASFLITTPQGHFLINSDYEESVPLLRASVEKLGYKFTDVKWLLSSQAHNDHSAGDFLFKELSGAKSAVMDGDADVMSSGGNTDFAYGGKPYFKPSKPDRVLHDGDTITLGGVTLTAHKTAGHTKGCTTWTMEVEDGGRKLNVVFVGGVGVNPGYKLVNNEKYPEIASDYAKTFATLKAIKCDVFLGAHGVYYGLDEKLPKLKEPGAKNPFIDPDGYRKFVEEAQASFERELARQGGTLTPRQRQLNLESFEYVWKTVRDKHWEKNPAGLDWQKVHDELRPQMEAAQTMTAARGILSDMLGRLHQSHFGVIPGDLYESTTERASGTGEATSGLDVRVIDHKALVTSVDPGSGAAKAGIQRGWEITRVNGRAVAEVVAKAEEAFANSSHADLLLRRTILQLLEGRPGTQLAIDFSNGAGQAVKKEITQGIPKGQLTRFGYLHPAYVWMDTGRMKDVGFARFNLFLDPTRLMKQFGDAVEACLHCEGFVIDLRGNPGGIGAMAMGMAGWFIDQSDKRLGTMFLRDTTIKFIINPRVQTFAGPVAILVDSSSASTSEILAGGMKDLGRARLFGTRTAAAALPSLFEILPNGDAFQYAIANYISEGGKPLEGNGAIPDEVTPLTREALLAGQDPAMDAALRWIESQRKTTTR